MFPRIMLEGFGIGAGLIIAIGAQNAFVLRQGIIKRHVALVALICSLIDIVLINAGVLGLGSLINAVPGLLVVASFGGALFLLWHAWGALRSVVHPAVLGAADGATAVPVDPGPMAVVLTLLGLSLLNPHVYLDTVVLLGGIGARYPLQERLSFIAGACTASVLWFFGLAFGAGLLAPLFRKALTWRLLDALIGGVMLFIAIQLVLFGLTKLGA